MEGHSPRVPSAMATVFLKETVIPFSATCSSVFLHYCLDLDTCWERHQSKAVLCSRITREACTGNVCLCVVWPNPKVTSAVERAGPNGDSGALSTGWLLTGGLLVTCGRGALT